MRVFFDSNVFLKFLGGEEKARSLIELVELGEIEGAVL
ncbi:hypothetical protein SAMN05216170_1925 [Thermococcus thioreducens]|uniref:PIN domain-containing protein n=1 Tax=Thermococcus thioreducens TaxID=277988 RepID=A0A1I0PM34_9EURY|nr:hypothetical protein SAMN05216170_1925 [Thermococcus thioreducens]